MNSNTLADYLQIWGLENSVAIFTDGSLGFALELSSVDPLCWNENSCNEFSGKISQFLNGLPEEIDIQFVQSIKNLDPKRIRAHSESVSSDSKTVSVLTQKRVEKFQKLNEQGQLPSHRLYVLVRKKMAKALLERPKWLFAQKDFENFSAGQLDVEIKIFERLRDDMQLALMQLGIPNSLMSGENIANMVYEQWNPTRTVTRPDYDPTDIRESLLFTDVGISGRGFSLADTHYRVISLKILPDQTYATFSSALRMLPFDSQLFLSIHIPNQMKEMEALKTQRRIAYSMVAGKKSGVRDTESEAKYRDLEQLLEDMVAQGERVFHVSLQIVLKSKNAEDLDSQIADTLLKLRELGGAEGLEESLAAFDIFSEIALPNARAKERTKRLKTSNLADFVPFYGPWAGHEDPKVLLRGRLGNLVQFDPFSPTLTNSNQIVSGGSGAGKSYMTNILLMQMMKENPRIFIIDIGGSYKKICESFGGQYVALGVDSDLSLNPFDLPPGEKKPSSHKIKFLQSLVEIMAKEETADRLGKLERTEIEDAIEQLYDSDSSRRLSTLQVQLANHSDPTVKRIGKILKSWCGDSAYGKFIDQTTTLKLEKSLVCFDLKGLDTYPDLQAVCLFIITDFVWREVQADRSRSKFLVLDECWKLMENDSACMFVAEVFRTFRKYRASAVAISQNIDDFAKSKIASAILPNSSIKWVLKQKGADKERLKEVLGLNETEVALINSLQQQKGVFSEAFLMAEDCRTVIVIESTALEYWLATSDPADLAMIDKMKAANPALDHLSLMEMLSEKYPRGVSNGASA